MKLLKTWKPMSDHICYGCQERELEIFSIPGDRMPKDMIKCKNCFCGGVLKNDKNSIEWDPICEQCFITGKWIVWKAEYGDHYISGTKIPAYIKQYMDSHPNKFD